MVPPDASVQSLWDASHGNGAPAFLIGTPDRLIGIVHAERLATAIQSGQLSDPVSSLLDSEIVHAHPDHPSELVLQRLAQSHGVLPIVSREDAQQVLGVVTFPQIMQFMRTRPARVTRHRSNRRGIAPGASDCERS